MNDKWFNIAMIILFTSLVANGFVLMLVSFPNGSTYSGLYQADADYATFKHDYNVQVSGDKITSATNDTYTPLTLLTGDPFGLAPLNMLITAFVGLELLLLTLASIFSMFSIILYTIVLVMFAVKAIMIAYFASMLIRFIFGGRQ